MPMSAPSDAVTVRTSPRPGDLPAIVRLHGTVYPCEHGFDATFESYVAGPLAEFLAAAPDRGRLWVAEREGRVIGCIAIVPATPETAQLRWFLVEPQARGAGLGRRLLNEALAFCRQCGYTSVFLWTVSALTPAARLYRAAGFQLAEERPGRLWGVDVVEQRYELPLQDTGRRDAEKPAPAC
jgi:GNAT superfamily N-acetyltransferase